MELILAWIAVGGVGLALLVYFLDSVTPGGDMRGLGTLFYIIPPLAIGLVAAIALAIATVVQPFT